MPQNFTRQLDRIDKKLNQTKFNINLDKKNSFYLFPYKLVLGFVNQTNIGINENISIYDFATWQRVFTGLANLTARWQDSWNVFKAKDDDLYLTKEFKVGKFFRAFITQKSQGVSFETSSIDNNFVSQLTNETITCYTYDDISVENLQDFYLVPQIRSNKWLYIENVTEHFQAGKTLYQITLTSVNNKIAQTGRAIEEYIQFGAPGEGYPYPRINDNGDVELDTTKAKDIYVQSYQVEVSGASAFSTSYCYGRPIEVKTDNGIIEPQFNPKIEAPRLLLPFSVETPIPSPINTKPSAETNYYYGIFNPKFDDYYKTWKEQMVNNFSLAERTQYEGVLTAPDKKKIEDSNPLNINDKAHQYTMWDKNWRIQIENTTFDTSADNMSPDSITLNGFYTLPQLLTLAIFITSPIETLPLSVEQLVSWNLRDLPIIGGFLNKLTFGIPIGWRQLNIRIPAPNIPLLIPSTIVKYGNVMREQSTANDLYMPLEIFSGTLESDATSFSGINTMGSILKIQLTDRFSLNINGATYTFNTKDLGQEPPKFDDEGKEIIYGDNKPIKLEINSTITPLARKKTGFVIDYSCWKGITKLPYRHTFFSSGDLQVHSGTYKSNALHTNSMRDWTNIMKLSDWKTDDNKYIEYPKDILEPLPPEQGTTNISLLNMLSVREVYHSNIFGTPNERVERIKNWFKTLYRQSGAINSYSTLQSNWIRQGYRNGNYDLTNIGGTAGLLRNYEFLVITISITLDQIPGELSNFTIKIPTTDLISSGFVEFDLKKDKWIDPRQNVHYRFLRLIQNPNENTFIGTIIQSAEGTPQQIGGKGIDALIFYNEYHNTTLRVEIDGSNLKFGWNENIEGFIPNQKQLSNGEITTDNNPAYPPYTGMFITARFSTSFALDQYNYRYDDESVPLTYITRITNIFLQTRQSVV